MEKPKSQNESALAARIERHNEANTLTEQFELLKKWPLVAAAIGITAYATVEKETTSNESSTNPTSISATETEVLAKIQSINDRLDDMIEKLEIAQLEEKIATKIGPLGVEVTRTGHVVAESNQDRQLVEPTYAGFEDIDIDTSDPSRHSMSEASGYFPRTWINGEIQTVVFLNMTNANYNETHNTYTVGEYINTSDRDRGFTIVYNMRDMPGRSEISSEMLNGFILETFAHETAHANDWITRGDLELIDRLRLFSNVLDRMNSDNAYNDKKIEGDKDYWRIFGTATEEARLRAAREYWAVICEAYFVDPVGLQTESVDDYMLVHNYIQSIDPEFTNH